MRSIVLNPLSAVELGIRANYWYPERSASSFTEDTKCQKRHMLQSDWIIWEL
jgi:hypothetical protein